MARIKENEAGGGRLVYHLQTEGAVARHRAKIGAKSSWFKRRKVEEVEWKDGRNEPRQPGVNATANSLNKVNINISK